MSSQAKILIVDDDPGYIKSVRAIIESKEEYTVDTASDKESAMEKIQKTKPDLILLDIMMGRIDDGFTICYRLKHDPELRKIPIILIEHDMGLVMDIAQRIVVLDLGEKIAEGHPEEIKANPAVIKAYLGD